MQNAPMPKFVLMFHTVCSFVLPTAVGRSVMKFLVQVKSRDYIVAKNPYRLSQQFVSRYRRPDRVGRQVGGRREVGQGENELADLTVIVKTVAATALQRQGEWGAWWEEARQHVWHSASAARTHSQNHHGLLSLLHRTHTQHASIPSNILYINEHVSDYQLQKRHISTILPLSA